MTEQEWLEDSFPPDMLRFLRGKVSDRKLRLFACEALRVLVEAARRCFPAWQLGLPEEDRHWKAPEVAARFADGLATAEELDGALRASCADYNTHRWLECACWSATLPDAWEAAKQTDMALRAYLAGELPPPLEARAEWALAAEMKRDSGDLWQAALVRDVFGNPFRAVTAEAAWLRWKDGAVPKMAHVIYDERAFGRLPLLADALEEAGCTSADVLGHCRAPGRHVCGCWVIDLLTGKS